MQRTVLTLLGAAVALPAAAAGVLVLDWKLAKRGAQLAEDPPSEHDGRIDGAGPGLRMVWLGDSSVVGAGASSTDTAIPRRVAAALDRPVDLSVLAVSGSRVHDVVVNQLEQVAALRPDVVLVSIGTNDVLYRTSRSEFRADHERLVDGLPADALVVFLGACDMGACLRVPQPLRAVLGWWGRVLDSAARAEVEARGGMFLDMGEATGPEMRRHPDRYYAVDQFHSNDEGYRLWADMVVAALRPALAERDRAGAVGDGHR